jgi:hypothetical protein
MVSECVAEVPGEESGDDSRNVAGVAEVGRVKEFRCLQ